MVRTDALLDHASLPRAGDTRECAGGDKGGRGLRAAAGGTRVAPGDLSGGRVWVLADAAVYAEDIQVAADGGRAPCRATAPAA